MAITSITRDWGVVPSIVRIVSTNTLAEVSAADYILSQAANISTVNNGEFTWLDTDFVAVSASDGKGLFSISSDFQSLVIVPTTPLLTAQIAVTAAEWNGMYAAPIALIAAPGADKMIIVDKLSLAMTYGTTQYAAGGAILAQYAATINGAGVPATATIAAATVNALVASTVLNAIGPASIVYAAAVNQGLYLSNQTAAFTTGDSDFVVTVSYHVIETA